MKNLKNLPTPIKFLMAISYMVILSIAFAFAFNMKAMMEAQSVIPALEAVGPIFLTLYALQFLFGPIIARYKRGAACNDSLVINDTTYAGTVAPYFILPAMFSFDSVVNKVVYVKDGIKKKHTIPTMDFVGPLQPRVAQPSQSGGNLTVAARDLDPKDVMAYQLMNPRNFEVHWDAENLSQTLLTRQLPATAENYIMLLLMGRSFEQFEIMTWQGSTQYQNNPNVPQFDVNGNPDPYFQIQFCDGLIKKMIGDSSIYTIANPVTLTVNNIVSAGLLPLYQSITVNNKGLLANDKKRVRMKFLVSYLTASLYEQYLTNQPYKGNDPTAAGLGKYLNWELIPCAGIPDNTIVFTEAMSTPEGNLWVGMNSVSDQNFMLARHRPDSELFFFKMLLKLDVEYGRSEKIFLYTTLVANDFVK